MCSVAAELRDFDLGAIVSKFVRCGGGFVRVTGGRNKVSGRALRAVTMLLSPFTPRFTRRV